MKYLLLTAILVAGCAFPPSTPDPYGWDQVVSGANARLAADPTGPYYWNSFANQTIANNERQRNLDRAFAIEQQKANALSALAASPRIAPAPPINPAGW